MTIADLLDRLGYAKSKNFLREDRGEFDRVVDYGHLFRRAAQDRCRLRGVYTLRQTETAVIPVVYVCDVQTEEAAKEVHKLVWNQDTVPFLVVNSPETVRVYPGFCYIGEAAGTPPIRSVHQAFEAANIERIADTLSASAVDSGDAWRAWGRHIRPEYRVDSKLLGNLRKLGTWLQKNGGLARADSNALIGKYVYLHYLKDRDILSDKKLQRWKIGKNDVFGRDANRDGLKSLQAELDDWLNGEVFPIDFDRPGAPTDEHVGFVAATFEGEEPLGGGQTQLHLDFKAYDFSYIPIEVLSIVYQQFLHVPDGKGKQTKGRLAGAYYTPIPVVNLMLSELEERLPLRRGMRVFDPACGSGAFLVQAFRRLIEKEFPPVSHKHVAPRDLRELVEAHFVGLDTDADACGVAKLSLILTMLDYVDPPDLEPDGRPGPKQPLPNLCENILHGNFFEDDMKWKRLFARRKADWVVGNPPWKPLTSKNMLPEDAPVLDWIKAEEKNRPVGNCQMARAFAWRAAEYVADDGEVALFLPAMTLFETKAKKFRSRFLSKMDVRTIVNFSNLRWIISGGRFTAPAAAFFFRPRPKEEEPTGEESIRTYSPMVANQEASRPGGEGIRDPIWSIVVNASEIREVPLAGVIDGLSLPWKMALWGSSFDARLIYSLRKKFPTIGDLANENLLLVRQGPDLKDGDPLNLPDGMVAVGHLLDKKVVNVKALEGIRHFFAFPSNALKTNKNALLRKRGGEAGLEVCKAPHVIVSAARNFAVFSEDFLVVPPRQIGIVSPANDHDFLKALSLFLSSDFAFYYEFFVSAELGVGRDRATLKTLRTIPTPLTAMPQSELKNWARHHDKLAKQTREAYQKGKLWQSDESQPSATCTSVVSEDMMAEMNALVYRALGMGPKEQLLVSDLVHVRFALNDGRLGEEAVRRPTTAEMRAYGRRLQGELDDYISGEWPGRHDIVVVHDDHSGMVRMTLDQRAAAKGRVLVAKADAKEAAAFEKCRRGIRKTRSQWVYFDRNLRVYDGVATYVLKPMQRFHWTETQARVDAMEIVAESIARRGGT
jgi:hypothetical protein